MDLHEQLAANPDLLHQVIDSFGEGVAIVDEEEKFLYINPAGASILGYPLEELTGKSIRDLVSEEEFEKILELTQERKKGTTNSHDHPVYGKDGSIRYVHVTSSPRYINGKFAGSYNLFVDITQQVRDKQTLAESENRFKAVSDIISDFAIFFSFRDDSSIQVDWLSGSITKITGYSETSLRNLDSWRKIGHPEDYEKLKQAVTQKVFTEHEPFSLRTRILDKSGEVKWVEIYANPRYSKKEHKLTEIVVAGREITEIKKTEDRLRLIEFMADHAAEGIYMIGKKGQILYANDSICSMLGYRKEEILSKTAFELDPNFEKKLLPEVWEQLKQQQVTTVESVLQTRERRIFPTEIILNFLLFEEEELLVAFVKDITGKKEEEHLRNLSYNIFRSINQATGLNRLILDIRNELSRIMDSRELRVILGNPTQETADAFIFKEGEIVQVQSQLAGSLHGWMLDTKKAAILKERAIQDLQAKGLVRPINPLPKVWIGAPLFVGEEVTGIISMENYEQEDALTEHHLEILELVCSQVSLAIQQKQSEDALRVSEKNLRESNISKDKFFSIIAHDLRGPFNSIIGFSELLHTDFGTFDEAEKRTMIRNIYEASVSTFKLLENLLEWSRIQTGRTKPDPENVDLSSIATNSLSFLKHQSEKKNIKLFSGIPFGTLAFCDENMVTTVIRNLISNAIKFTPSGGEVRIWAGTRDKLIEVVVADTGVGIEAENLPKLFRLDESYKTWGTDGERGTGLGLILCREFIELNGGKIWAESTPDKGSQFKFTLPKFQF